MAVRGCSQKKVSGEVKSERFHYIYAVGFLPYIYGLYLRLFANMRDKIMKNIMYTDLGLYPSSITHKN